MRKLTGPDGPIFLLNETSKFPYPEFEDYHETKMISNQGLLSELSLTKIK